MIMNATLEILKILLPSLVVMATAYYLIKTIYENETKRKESENSHQSKQKLMDVKMKNKELIMPVRLQAYERIILFLERISPYSLIMRLHTPGMTVAQLQTILIRTIRDEFEHNLSQQLYMSKEAWVQVKTARDEMTKLVNAAAMSLQPESTGTELSQRVIEMIAQQQTLPTDKAIDFVKNEINDVF